MANMTRQHFQFIAEVLGSLEDSMEMNRETMRSITWEFADCLRATNSAFDSDRFFKAVEAHRLLMREQYTSTGETGHPHPEVNFNKSSEERSMPDEEKLYGEKLRADEDKYDGVPADTGTHE